MTIGNDSPEVFITRYLKIKDWCDDDPTAIYEMATADEKFKELCLQLLHAVDRLRAAEERGRRLYTAPVDPKFLSQWRDFEDRYEGTLFKNWASWLSDTVKDYSDSVLERWKTTDGLERRRAEALEVGNRLHRIKTGDWDRDWEEADGLAEVYVDFLDRAVAGAYFRAIGEEHEEAALSADGLSEEEGAGLALDSWTALTEEIGFDLRGARRRRALAPFVFFPRHVAARHATPEKALLYKRLEQAYDAFIFGVPLAAVALMRSAMEAVLVDHYGAQGENLSEKINSVRSRLPNGANTAALHRLRVSANRALHHDVDKDQLPMLDDARAEREMVSLLGVLRTLIERVPQR